jgi:hypothetical protein
MTISRHRTSTIAIACAVLIVIAAAMDASAQSNYYPPTPAQGPPPNLSASSQQFTIDSFITRHCCDETTGAHDGLYDQIEQAIAENNAAYGVGTSGAVITATKKRYAPWMYSTQYTNRPNQNIVQISYYITYDITDIYWHGIPYPFSRTAGQSIDVQISCDGWYPWYQGKGDLTLTSIVSAPVLDSDPSVLEDTLGGIFWQNVIPQYVDSEITAKLTRFGKGTHRRSLGFSCNTLGTKAFSDAPSLDHVLWDFLRPRFPALADVFSQLTVRVAQVRRLTAHDLENDPLYYAVETPRLELYAGYNSLVLDLPQMQEGQVFVPGPNAVVSSPIPPTNAQYSGRFVIIANMSLPAQYIEDTAFAVFDKASDFGAGTRIINTPKLWWYHSTLSRKPILMRTKAYEVTLQISGPPTTATVVGFTQANRSPTLVRGVRRDP